MFSYHGPLNFPDLPLVLVITYLRKYQTWGTLYAARWARLVDLGMVPVNVGAEVFEYAESTVRTYFSDDEWFGEPAGGPSRVLFYQSGFDDGDWLQLNDLGFAPQRLQEWRDTGHYELPDSTFFGSSRVLTNVGWVVWHMHLLHVAESVMEMREAYWHKLHPV